MIIEYNQMQSMQQFQQVRQTSYLPFKGVNAASTGISGSSRDGLKRIQPFAGHREKLSQSYVQYSKSGLQDRSQSQISQRTMKPATTLFHHQQQAAQDLHNMTQQSWGGKDINYELVEVKMTQVFESLYQQSDLETSVSGSSLQTKNSTIKMMDTILFDSAFKPKKWIFTDLLGRIQFKDINSITINDVIKAFLVNLNENKKNEFNNEDLMDFLANNQNRSKICFAIQGNTRHFLSIEALSDIKNRFSKGLDALQLYKIPTREFLPYFFFHTLTFKGANVLQSHMLTRLSHFVKDLDTHGQKCTQEFYEESVPDQEYRQLYEGGQLLELSRQIVDRVQMREGNGEAAYVKSIKIAYLVEKSNYDPWFIGTEHCQVYQKVSQQRSKSQLSRSQIGFNRSSTVNSRLSQYPQSRQVTPMLQDLSMNTDIARANTAAILLPMVTQSDSVFKIKEQDEEEVFELSNNDYITQSDLFKGLLKIGQQYGKDANASLSVKRPKTMQMLTQEKSRKVVQYQQLQADQRSRLKEKGRRIVDLFPRYLEKSGSKAHSAFLFGNVSSDRVFKDYQRLRFQNQQKEANLILSSVEQKASKSFVQGAMNRSIFDIPLCDVTQQMTQNYPEDNAEDMPYQDNSYDGLLRQEEDTSIQELSHEAILNKDISMFQPVSASAIGNYQNSTIYAAQESQRLNSTRQSMGAVNQSKLRLNTQGNQRAKNDFLTQSLYESNLLDESILKLGDNDFEKNMLQLVLINQDLEGIVVLDKDQAISSMKQRLLHEQSSNLHTTTLGCLPTQSDVSGSEQIFTGNRRRKLNGEEARTYHQWKNHQVFQPKQGESELVVGQEVSINDKAAKRSRTAADFKKRNHGAKKPRVLDLLQVKGQEAHLQHVPQQHYPYRIQPLGHQPTNQKKTHSDATAVTASLKSSIINVKSTLERKDDQLNSITGDTCNFQLYCNQPLKLDLGLSARDMCYIARDHFMEAERIIAEHGQDTIINQFKKSNLKIHRKKISDQSQKVESQRLSQEFLNNIKMKGSEVLNTVIKNCENKAKKDMSIDVQNSLRNTNNQQNGSQYPHSSSENESARKYFVRVPLFNDEASAANNNTQQKHKNIVQQKSDNIVPCCSRCFTIINYMLK